MSFLIFFALAWRGPPIQAEARGMISAADWKRLLEPALVLWRVLESKGDSPRLEFQGPRHKG